MPTRRLLGLLATFGLLGACTTTHELTPINMDGAVIQRLDPERAWSVVDGERVCGYVVRFVDRNSPTRCSYSVRNELQQELGTIDELGRVWRYVPHQREAEWVCTSTLIRGSAMLLEAGAEARLEQVEFASLVADSAAR